MSIYKRVEHLDVTSHFWIKPSLLHRMTGLEVGEKIAEEVRRLMEVIRKQPLINLRHLQKQDSNLRLTHSLKQQQLLYQSINLILDRLTITFLVRLLVVSYNSSLPLELELHRRAKMLSRSRTLLLASAIALGATTLRHRASIR